MITTMIKELSEPLWPYLLVGIIISVTLSVLNFRYIWWPLNPHQCGVRFSGGSAQIFPALILDNRDKYTIKPGRRFRVPVFASSLCPN